MNNETNTIDERSMDLGRTGTSQTGLDAQLDEELKWICLKVMALVGKRPPSVGVYSARQMILFAANRYDGLEPQRFERLCRGLHLMSERHYREALGEFDIVLRGQVEPEFEIFRELALEAHAVCLQQLDFDDDALEEFTLLLHRKFQETRDNGEADHVAKLLGLARLEHRGAFTH